MPRSDGGILPGLPQTLAREFVDGLQHRIARSRCRIITELHQTLIYQPRELIERGAGVLAHGFHRVDVESSTEHCQAPKDPLLRWSEQVVAPPDRSFQRLLPLGQIGCSAGQQRQAMREPLVHRAHRQVIDARGRQLDRQRQPIQPLANVRDQQRSFRP